MFMPKPLHVRVIRGTAAASESSAVDRLKPPDSDGDWRATGAHSRGRTWVAVRIVAGSPSARIDRGRPRLLGGSASRAAVVRYGMSQEAVPGSRLHDSAARLGKGGEEQSADAFREVRS